MRVRPAFLYEPHRLRISGTRARDQACPLELADHIIRRGFVPFRSDVATFPLIVGQKLNVRPPSFSRRCPVFFSCSRCANQK